jgi:hypothetical protein
MIEILFGYMGVFSSVHCCLPMWVTAYIDMSELLGSIMTTKVAGLRMLANGFERLE